MQSIQLHLTVDQARVVQSALDLYTQMGLGQLEKLTELARMGVVPRAGRGSDTRQLATAENLDFIEALLKQAKAELGYPSNGSHGVGHPHNHESTHRAYEIYKVVSKTLAELANPRPTFRSVSYDGLLLRYTKDPEPTATVVDP